jgi:hypothetical protein
MDTEAISRVQLVARLTGMCLNKAIQDNLIFSISFPPPKERRVSICHKLTKRDLDSRLTVRGGKPSPVVSNYYRKTLRKCIAYSCLSEHELPGRSEEGKHDSGQLKGGMQKYEWTERAFVTRITFQLLRVTIFPSAHPLSLKKSSLTLTGRFFASGALNLKSLGTPIPFLRTFFQGASSGTSGACIPFTPRVSCSTNCRFQSNMTICSSARRSFG